MVLRFAVIGQPIKHSLSPIIHQHFSQQTQIPLSYERIDGDASSFEQQVAHFFAQGGKGLNITLPFKQKAYEMAEKKTTSSALAGAVNTLWVHHNQLQGDNTDGIGLVRDLSYYLALPNQKILILGTGGAARGIIHPLLATAPASLTVACRTIENTRAFQEDFPQVRLIELKELSEPFDLIINATSASLEGKTIELSQQVLANQPFCYDLAYHQKEATPFVNYARDLGCSATDGMGMLVEQAAESFYIWNGIRPETREVLTWIKNKDHF